MSNKEKFVLTPSRLSLTAPANLAEWEVLGRRLCNMQRSVSWWIGDMLVMGEATFGDDIFQAFDETMSPTLVERCARVCREFAPLERNATLSFTHHQVLLGLPKPVQQSLLDQAEVNGWDSERMRRAVKEIKG